MLTSKKEELKISGREKREWGREKRKEKRKKKPRYLQFENMNKIREIKLIRAI